MQDFRQLNVWQKAHAFTLEIYIQTAEFPKEELYSLTSQVIRSSRSISANITEGWSKRHYEISLRFT